MNNLDKLQSVPVRAKCEFDIGDGTMIAFAELSRKWLVNEIEPRFPEVYGALNGQGDFDQLADELIAPFSTAVIAQGVAAFDGPVTPAIRSRVEKMIDERIPPIARVPIMLQIMQASTSVGFKRGPAAPSPKNRQQRRAATKTSPAKTGARGRKHQPISA